MCENGKAKSKYLCAGKFATWSFFNFLWTRFSKNFRILCRGIITCIVLEVTGMYSRDRFYTLSNLVQIFFFLGYCWSESFSIVHAYGITWFLRLLPSFYLESVMPKSCVFCVRVYLNIDYLNIRCDVLLHYYWCTLLLLLSLPARNQL